MAATTGKRNGKIELMRFVFCMLIILFHANNQLHIKMPEHFSFFTEGKIGVEFFFLVSGYLLAKNARKHFESPRLVYDTKWFIYKKFLGILPYHVIAYVVCLAIVLVFTTKHSLARIYERLIVSLPSFFLLQKSGIDNKEILTPEWYIAAMLLMMMIIYPLVLRYQDKFTKIAAPIITIWLIGYMAHMDGKLGGASRFSFDGVLPKAYVRAFAEMCGGLFCYEVAQFISRLKFKKFDRILLTAVEFICYLLPVCYSFSDWSQSFEVYAFYSLTIAVTLSFSEITLLNSLFKNKLVYWLGHMSLPLYYCQRFGFVLVNVSPISGWQVRYKLLFCLVLTFATAIIIEPLSKQFMKLYNQKVALLRERKLS